MEPLFEAQATVNEKLTSYNVYRLSENTYKITLKHNEDDDDAENLTGAPAEFTMKKTDGKWCTEAISYGELCSTIGTEIDVFNYGYGDLLGRIGVNR